jgi:predicted esterase
MILGTLVPPVSGQAPAERYELGQRLRALEKVWDVQSEAEARQRATPHLKRAVTTFFAFQPGEAGRCMDLARFALQSPEGPPSEVRWAESLRLQTSTRLADRADPVLGLTLSSFYNPNIEKPGQVQLRVALVDAAGKEQGRPWEAAIEALPVQGKLSLKGVAEGDRVLRLEIRQEKKLLVRREIGVSCVADCKRRLEELQKAADQLPREPLRTDRETLRGHLRLLDVLARGEALETDYPAARLLAEAEALQATIAKETEFYRNRAGQFWLTLATGRTASPVRLLAPEAVKQGKPLPLIVALHGAGGSENLFFEGYGRGTMVRGCQQRGWLLVAPRGTGFVGTAPLAELIDEVARFYPVDRKKVFLVGHSLGAMQAVSAASTMPEKIAAVVALSGGGTLRSSEELKKVAFFAGVGSEDFALLTVRGLHEQLKKAEVENVRYREYPGIEHMMIVDVAGKDFFSWLDELARR